MMMKALHVVFLLLVMASFASAESKTVSFANSPSRGFCAREASTGFYMDVNGNYCLDAGGEALRIRVIDPIATEYSTCGFALERPFLVLDGIYLGIDGQRTLQGFQDEVSRIGLLETLSELGYTPVLVQFSETVTRSLKENGEDFAKLLKFLNGKKLFYVENRKNGFVVMGISQGGILGRYGAYLYDIGRSVLDAPISLYASLDSPHQGAILPISLYYTIDFWATYGGSAEAEAFKDLVGGPGASGLMLYDHGEYDYFVNTKESRFLFGEYRNAAEYKGFPSVLIAQGQLKGVIPSHNTNYFRLNRFAEGASVVVGRVVSEMSSNVDDKENAFNRIYKMGGSSAKVSVVQHAVHDFIQGSTYPFAETMYNSLRSGFESGIRDGMKVGSGIFSFSLEATWSNDVLNQKNSTFIPTASAMDMKCGGNLAIRNKCAFLQKSDGFPFMNPGDWSTATATYAVDPTHPRYGEPISGRHVELPSDGLSEMNGNVARGIRVDMWRILCELANRDYNGVNRSFMNEKLEGHFVPGTNCMDQTKIPVLLQYFGTAFRRPFGFSRYNYAEMATEFDDVVSFDVPAGWHKVSQHDNGTDIPGGTVFEIEVKVNSAGSRWLKAELLLSKNRNGSGQLQLKEIDVPRDGEYHVLRWNLPAAPGALDHYRWFTLVLNSEGANVSLRKPALFYALIDQNAPMEKVNSRVYPGDRYKFVPWAGEDASVYSDALGSGVELKYGRIGGGVHVDFGGMKSLEGYTTLQVNFWPGTCEGTGVYFDSNRKGLRKLTSGRVEGNFNVAEIPLASLVNTLYTPEMKLSASRLVFENVRVGERCLVHDIVLK